ncbi:MAG: hypothetical protein ACLQVG_25550 [Terriglobia bacterium]
MRKLIMLMLAGTTLLPSGLAWAQKRVNSRRPAPVMQSEKALKDVVPLTVGSGSVTPASITLTSATPDGTQTNSTTKVSFKVTSSPASFHVYAKAGAANFTGCNTPPTSSVTVACGSASGVTCAASAALSNTGNGTTVATGSGNHTTASFNLTYTFQDAWNYSVGSTCQLTVSYIYTEP